MLENIGTAASTVKSVAPTCRLKLKLAAFSITFRVFLDRLNIKDIFIPLFILMFRVTDHPQSGWLEFLRHQRKNQRHGSALIGAGITGCKAPG